MIKLKHLLPECNECGRDWNHGHDHEAGMAKNELRDMISNASKIDQMIGEGDNLPGWVSAYISLAADYMHSVAEYLAGESSRIQKPGPGYGTNSAVVETDITPMFTQLHPKDRTLQQYVDVLKKDPNIAAAIEYESDFKDALKRRIYIHGDKDEIGRTAGIVLQIDKHGDRYSGDNFGRIYKMFKNQNTGPGYGLEEDLDAPQGNSYEEVIDWLDNTYPDPSQYPAFVSAFKKELTYLPEPTRKEWIARFNADFGSLSERKKPSTGLTKAQKSAVSKKAHAGKDIGKKGPGFEKVAKAAEKKYGSKEAGEKVAAAAMWKNVKRK